jgi:hypothetical protein
MEYVDIVAFPELNVAHVGTNRELCESGVAVERPRADRRQDERVRWKASRARSSASGRVWR